MYHLVGDVVTERQEIRCSILVLAQINAFTTRWLFSLQAASLIGRLYPINSLCAYGLKKK